MHNSDPIGDVDDEPQGLQEEEPSKLLKVSFAQYPQSFKAPRPLDMPYLPTGHADGDSALLGQ